MFQAFYKISQIITSMLESEQKLVKMINILIENTDTKRDLIPNTNNFKF